MLSSVQKLLLGFVTLIVGILLVGVIADQMGTVTSVSTTSQTIDLANARLAGGKMNNTYPFTIGATNYDGWQASDSGCSTTALFRETLISSTNSTGGTLTEGSCDTADYSLTAGTNTVYFCNSANVNQSVSNATTVTYEYCSDNYLSQSWSRNTLVLIVGLFAIALLIFSVGLFYSVMKENGIF